MTRPSAFHFFVDKPVFASVLALLTVLAGALALTQLPIAQYPDVVPPQVVVTATYPGATAKTVSETVAAPIEEQVNGVDNMMYMESQATNDGSLRLIITFKAGTDPDLAQVLVQNRVSIALPRLPEEVRRLGVTTKKQSSAILLVVNLFAKRDAAEEAKERGVSVNEAVAEQQLRVSSLTNLRIKDPLARIEGVGDVFLFGNRDYSMRIWLDPDKMADLSLTATEVIDAVRKQNVQVSAGQIGQPPTPRGQNLQLVVNTAGRLTTEQAFRDIVVKSGANEQLVLLKDVARIELGARSYDASSALSGRPSVGVPIFQLPGANAFSTARKIKETMATLRAAPDWPADIEYAIIFDPTEYVKASVDAVVQTLFEAILLVFVVVLVFLQNWRAAVIPMLAVPVALVGTLAAMFAMGYSINSLTLFGLVLAIGIVVDDAIVVVEAVEYHIARGLSPADATRRAMSEVGLAVIGVSLVLCAVFVPAAVIPGLTGQFFKQFAVTIAVSTLLSAFNALTLSPALTPILLRPHAEGHVSREPLPRWVIALILGVVVLFAFGPKLAERLPAAWPGGAKDALIVFAVVVPGYFLARLVNAVLVRFFRGFNWGFDRVTRGYGWSVGWLMRLSLVVLLVYGGLLFLTYRSFRTVPGGFIPQSDQGYLVLNCQLPEGASLERTEAVMKRAADICLSVPGVSHTVEVAGFSVLAQANIPNCGGMYLPLTPFAARPGRTADMIQGELAGKLAAITDARVDVFGAPPILGLETLEGQTWGLVGAATKEPGIPFGFSTFQANTPQLFVEVDRDRVEKMGVSVQAVNDALQAYLGSVYVNDITLDNRNWQVTLQADAAYRDTVEGLKRIKVRGPGGQMIPIAGLTKVKNVEGPAKVNRYQMFPAADINGVVAPPLSTAQALAKMEALARRDLPIGLDFEWTDMAYQQKGAENTRVEIPGVFEFRGDTTLLVFGLSVLVAFLVLGALYESWVLPLAIVLIVPMCLLCAAAGLIVTGLDLNIFTQIGLVVLVGLATKNAILIVEFAKQKREAGQGRFEAARDASTQRLRPILMTSFAFILGVLPLVRATGAGAEMRRSLGTAVFSGMLGVTLFGVFLTPVFYVVLQRLRDRGTGGRPAAQATEPGVAVPASTKA